MRSAFTAACVQFCAGQDITSNVAELSALIREAAARGAVYVQTPENSAIMANPDTPPSEYIVPQERSSALIAFRRLADQLKIWLHIGSLAVSTAEGKNVNRSFVITPDGVIAATYDKVHLFDVDLSDGESYRESDRFCPGDKAKWVDLPWCRLGLSICYDIRFAYLYRLLAQAGSSVLTAPAAFTLQTGEAHWHVLQRARAIETGSFVISAAQAGLHENGRMTYGHSLIVSPWGDIRSEAEQEPAIILGTIDPLESDQARRRIPALQHDRALTPPLREPS